MYISYIYILLYNNIIYTYIYIYIYRYISLIMMFSKYVL